MTLINHGYLLPLRADYPGADVLPVFNQADTPQEAALAGEMLEGMGETSGDCKRTAGPGRVCPVILKDGYEG